MCCLCRVKSEENKRPFPKRQFVHNSTHRQTTAIYRVLVPLFPLNATGVGKWLRFFYGNCRFTVLYLSSERKSFSNEKSFSTFGGVVDWADVFCPAGCYVRRRTAGVHLFRWQRKALPQNRQMSRVGQLQQRNKESGQVCRRRQGPHSLQVVLQKQQ